MELNYTYSLKIYTNLSYWEKKQIDYYTKTYFEQKDIEFYKPFNTLNKYLILINAKNNRIFGFISLINLEDFRYQYKKVYPNKELSIPTITLKGLFINNLFIHPNYRKKSFGILIINHIINYANNNNFDHIVCQVYNNNIPAMKLYQKMKFRSYMVGICPNNNQKCSILYYSK